MRKYQQIVNLLESLKLKGMIPNLDNEITEAEEKKISYLSFLDLLLKAEIDYRTERRLKRNLVGAHFPVEKQLDDFQFARVKGITKSDLSSLMDFLWLDNHSNLLFFGPPGIGKSHLSISIAIKALMKGYKVLFTPVAEMLHNLNAAKADNTYYQKVDYYLKPDLLILDELGFKRLPGYSADDFFEIISKRYEKGSVIEPHKTPDSCLEM